MKIIGLTGGIASGKSTVSNFLKELGASVFDADEVSRNALKKGAEGFEKVIELLGTNILLEDGSIDRQKVANIVFNDKEALKKLEKIVHEFVWMKAQEFIIKHKNENKIVLDVPLLIETKWYKEVDEIWVVSVPVEEQIKRAVARNNMSIKDVKARIESQMSLEDKLIYADRVIENTGSLEETKMQVEKYWTE
jgi:dephospho-CoA kinase